MIDYAKYSNKELEQCLSGIDTEKFPENYARLQLEISNRNLQVVDDDAINPAKTENVENWLESAQEAILEQVRHNLNGQKDGKSNTLYLLILTAIIFGLGAAVQFDMTYALLVIPVLFVHELGHLFAMKALKYKNVSILFIPFFGALTTGVETSPSRKNDAIISMAGPILGLFVGFITFVVHLNFMESSTLLAFAHISFALNLINLLPIMPLDGGRIWEAILTSRSFIATAIFDLLSAILLVVCAIKLSAYILIPLAVFILLKGNEALIARSAKKYVAIQSEDVQDIYSGKVWEIVQYFDKSIHSKQNMRVKDLAFRTSEVIRWVKSSNPSIEFSVASGMTYLATFIIGTWMLLMILPYVARK